MRYPTIFKKTFSTLGTKGETVYSGNSSARIVLVVSSDFDVVKVSDKHYDYRYRGICFSQMCGLNEEHCNNALLGIGLLGEYHKSNLNKAIAMSKECV